MDIESLRIYCLQKPGVSEELPFGPDTLVFKVGLKIFLLIGLDQVDALSFNVKCAPEWAIELRESYPQTVFPGYHMNKKHWNTVFAHREADDHQLREWIDHSYDLVFRGLPKKQQEEIKEME
ncbi:MULTISPECIES: MmcQ/YjbR family DNA-binding protein [Sphingobacterium]|uniref:MmcQ/YjbR family DNA-binding protein n=1 Tax=Sphingobacterium populi TaxID=1812824 RepID=A0ABW5UC20_9SPHI|nr:MmcQ/YjbR family DNA-binding protein [Sphingobacterium sp. CFCC 11742]